MTLFRLFQLCLYLLVVAGSLLLAYAEAYPVSPPLFTPLVAIAAFLFVEGRKPKPISAATAGGLGVAALFIAAAEFLTGTIEAKLLSGAHLTVYFTWIVLWQRKAPRQYWLLCALSVLQVALGAIMTLNGLFGLLVLVYGLFGMWTLSLLSLHLIRERIASAEQTISDIPFVELQKKLPKKSAVELAASRTMQSRGAVHRDPNERWIGVRFVAGYIVTAFAALFIAAFFFIFIPRTWIAGTSVLADAASPLARTSVTGFSSDVQLGGAGEILESTNTVMEVKLTEDGKDLGVPEYARRLGFDEPYFRGNVQELYNANRSRWEAVEQNRRRMRIDAEGPLGEATITQHISLNPVREPILFAMHPVVAGTAKNQRQIHVHQDSLVLSVRTAPKTTFDYVIHSSAVPRRGARKAVISPSWRPVFFPDRRRLAIIRERCLQLPESGMDYLIQTARRVALDDPNDPQKTDVSVRINRLVRYLRDSGEFGYTLKQSTVDSSIDPIVDFLKNRKAGHCVYFASSLTLMLRAVGVPARMVNGFKGGSYNTFSKSWIVQERHAHAWVEALIGRRWETYDPTSSEERNAEMESIGDKFSSFSSFTSMLHDFWQSGVLNMSFEKQKAEIYNPLKRSATNWWNSVKESGSPVKAIWSSVWSVLSDPSKWFSLMGLVVTFGLLLFIALAIWIGRRVARVAKWAIRAKKGGWESTAVAIHFFERFQKICRERGFTRKPSETPREFADAIKKEADVALAAAGLGTLPSALAHAFYQIRYGKLQLTAAEIGGLEKQLSHLQSAWSAKHSR